MFNPNRKLHPFWVKITVSAQVDHHIRMFNLPVYPLGTTLTMGIIVDDSDTCSKPISRAILPTSFSCTSYLKKSSSSCKIIYISKTLPQRSTSLILNPLGPEFSYIQIIQTGLHTDQSIFPLIIILIIFITFSLNHFIEIVRRNWDGFLFKLKRVNTFI